jgi:hypothetical protein
VCVVCSYCHTFAGGSRNERGQVRRTEKDRERGREMERKKRDNEEGKQKITRAREMEKWSHRGEE